MNVDGNIQKCEPSVPQSRGRTVGVGGLLVAKEERWSWDGWWVLVASRAKNNCG